MFGTSLQWEFHLDMENTLGQKKNNDVLNFFLSGSFKFYCVELVVGC